MTAPIEEGKLRVLAFIETNPCVHPHFIYFHRVYPGIAAYLDVVR